MKLNNEGAAYQRRLTKQMKSLGLYIPGDEHLMIHDTAIQYQLYQKELELSIDEPKTYHHMRSQRHYKNVLDNLKQLGIGPMQRSKMKVIEEEEKKSTILDAVAGALTDMSQEVEVIDIEELKRLT